MPTGYTAKVADGDIVDLESFALKLARGMGALVAMRDEPWDAPIPESFEPSDFYKKQAEQLEAEVNRLDLLTLEEAEAEQEREIAERKQYLENYVKKQAETKQRYEAMIAKVDAWTGAPEGIKEFAMSQLQDSLKFDCGGSYLPSVPEKIPSEVWLASKIIDVFRDLTRARNNYSEEVERVDARNKWLKQLRESLK